MRFFSFLVALPLTVVTVLFAGFNTTRIELTITPFQPVIEVPLYVIGLGALVIGFLSGALMVWFNSNQIRLERWQESRRADRLEKELTRQKEEVRILKSEDSKTTRAVETIQPRPKIKFLN